MPVSYEERIINRMQYTPIRRGVSSLQRDREDFDAIRAILKPLYDRCDELETELQEARGALIRGYGKRVGL